MARRTLLFCLTAVATLLVRLIFGHVHVVAQQETGAPSLMDVPPNVASQRTLNNAQAERRKGDASPNQAHVKTQYPNFQALLQRTEVGVAPDSIQADTEKSTRASSTGADALQTLVASSNRTPSEAEKISGRQFSRSRLRVCSPRKVASTATNKIRDAWNKLPKASKRHPRFHNRTKYSFAIVRDPLERLYSGYHNKCLHQRENEPDQCPNFPIARENPPTFEQFLQVSHQQPRLFHKNLHFSSMSKPCPLLQFDQVFHMSSPTFNKDVAELWLALGAPLEVVEKDFPLGNETDRRQHSYYANAAKTAATHYSCDLILLALPLLVQDYQGYKEFFPIPSWAQTMLQEEDCRQKLETQTAQEQEKKQQQLESTRKHSGKFRQLNRNRLQVCTPLKVASSATEKIMAAWKMLPVLPKTLRNPQFENGRYSFAIVRDPLERLYSGYSNKCLHQRENEPDQCPGFPQARNEPPTLDQFLEAVHANPKEFMANRHFSPMSRQCQPDRFDQVFHMSSSTFNKDVAELWLSLGAPPEVVLKDFPLNGTERQLHSYHANAAGKVTTQYNCSTLLLAIPLLKEDYQGQYQKFFPLPQWADKRLRSQKCRHLWRQKKAAKQKTKAKLGLKAHLQRAINKDYANDN